MKVHKSSYMTRCPFNWQLSGSVLFITSPQKLATLVTSSNSKRIGDLCLGFRFGVLMTGFS